MSKKSSNNCIKGTFFFYMQTVTFEMNLQFMQSIIAFGANFHIDANFHIYMYNYIGDVQ